MGVTLSSLTWPEVAARAATLLVAVPLGSTEQHGPHLPRGTDNLVAEAVCRALAASRDDVVVAPTLPYGSAGEHAGFAGTLSIGAEGLALAVTELVRSADAFAGTVLVSGHGGNAEVLSNVVASLRSEGRRVTAWWPRLGPGADAHAGRTETSLVLALDAGSVRVERAEAGCTDPLPALWDRLRHEGVAAVSPNGVLGDPSGASADEGGGILAELVDDLRRQVAAEWGPR